MLFDRLKINADDWSATVSQLLRTSKRTGTHLGPRARLAAAAQSHGRRWHRNALPQA